MKRKRDELVSSYEDFPTKKKQCLYIDLSSNSDDNNNSEDESVCFITAHFNTDAVIWSEDESIIPLHHGKFQVGWKIDSEEDNEVDNAIQKHDHPNETMFLVKNPSNLSTITNWMNEITVASQFFNNASCILLIVGAGMGCDSNLPDYRSATGFWKQYKPLMEAGISLQDMSKSQWFVNGPTLAWGFYSHRQHLYANAQPHEGFDILLNKCKSLNNYFVVTSNVDSQFQKAGFNEDIIFETHGSLAYQQCTKPCNDSSVWLDENVKNGKPLPIDKSTFRIKDKNQLPKCNKCNALARPNVSFFTDTDETFNNTRQYKQKMKLYTWLNKIKNNKSERLLVIEIGCGTSIHSLRFESEIILYHTPELDNRVSFIRINPKYYNVEKNNKSQVGIGLGAKAALKALANNKL